MSNPACWRGIESQQLDYDLARVRQNEDLIRVRKMNRAA
jgi:hypothetical protein